MMKSMLHERGLPMLFWAEAAATAIYLLNRCPTKAVTEMTPIEAWSGRKPSIISRCLDAFFMLTFRSSEDASSRRQVRNVSL
ncbi:hypothetical protein ACHQM5_003191 [Ranunculus cassubicifolius]